MSRGDGLSASCRLYPRKLTSVRALAEDAAARAVFANPDLPAGDLAVQRLPVIGRVPGPFFARPIDGGEVGVADLGQDGFALLLEAREKGIVGRMPLGHAAL